MVLTLDFTDDGVRRWSKTDCGVTSTVDEAYTPSIYVTSSSELAAFQEQLDRRGDVVSTTVEQWRTGFREPDSAVLRVDLASIDRVRPVARWVRSTNLAGANRCFNVDLSPQFRYCLETDTDPTPTHPLQTCRLSVEEIELIEPPLTEL